MKPPRSLHKFSEVSPPKITHSPKETREFARELAQELAERGTRRTHATVLGLVGDLGAGKTTFTQGFAQGLDIKHHVTSPTFVIFRNYKIPNYKLPNYSLPITHYQHFYHVDAYRIHNVTELKHLGFKKILSDPKNIVLVEWAENIKKSLPRSTVYINFTHGKEDERKIEIR